MQGIANDPSKDKRKNHPKIDRNVESLPGEVWKDINKWKGHTIRQGYQISNLGRVRNLGRVITQLGNSGKLVQHPYPACMLRLTSDHDGYLYVGLPTETSIKLIGAKIHQLVAYYFIDSNPDPEKFQVNHKDGNKNNNTPDNLEWVTPDENNKHARETGLARLGTSQAISGLVVEWNRVFDSKTKTDAAIGRYAGYIDRCHKYNMPIIDKNSGQEVHVKWLEKEDTYEC